LSSDIEAANKYLGYDYFFSGEVIEGDKIGRSIGYPTANVAVKDENKLIPGNGVYAVHLQIKGRDKLYKGMMNIGFRPTVGGTKKMIEINIFDFDENIYNQQITIILKKHLRQEIKFDGLEALQLQLAKDKNAAQVLLKKI
jgi:riboflavin kinase/FMN adenylyltransferase